MSLEIEVVHVHNESQRNVRCEFIESNDSYDNGMIYYWFKCPACNAQIGIKIKPKKEETPK